MPWLALLTPRTLFWAAIALLCVALGIQTTRLAWAKEDIAKAEARYAQVEAQRERIAREATASIAKLQAEHAAATQALSDAYQADVDAQRNAAAVASADADELRRAVEQFTAARAGHPTTDAAAVEYFKHQAGTLGNLFRKADKLAEELAGDAERRNAEVRALQSQLAADRKACE